MSEDTGRVSRRRFVTGALASGAAPALPPAAPGRLLAYGSRLREQVGRIHWTGTETSDHWNGYMDGAVRSGERAAAEALAEP